MGWREIFATCRDCLMRTRFRVQLERTIVLVNSMVISNTLSRISDLVIFFLAIFIVVTNSLLISLIIRCRNLLTVTNTLVVSVAVADLVLAPGLMIYIAVRFIKNEDFVRIGYSLAVIIMGISPMMSVVSFFLVSLERCVAVCCPMTYTRKVSLVRAKVVMSAFWIVNCVFVSLCLLHYISEQPVEVLSERVSPRQFIPRSVYYWFYGLEMTGLFSLTVILNFKIYFSLRNKSRRISVMCRGPTARIGKPGESMRILKMIMTSLFVTTITEGPAFLIGYFPTSVSTLTMATVAFWAFSANSFLTPIIHIFMNRSYKTAFYASFGCDRFSGATDTSCAAVEREIPRRRRAAIVAENISVIPAWDETTRVDDALRFQSPMQKGTDNLRSCNWNITVKIGKKENVCLTFICTLHL